jgi:hypothetical protein
VSLSDPYTEMFTLTNEGYAPVTQLQIDCLLKIRAIKFGQEGGFSFPMRAPIDPARVLGHESRITVPCIVKISGLEPTAGSKLDITISYAFWHLNLPWLRRSETFHFLSIGSTDSQHWQIL